MAKNRYDNATASEKQIFTAMAKVLKENAPTLGVSHRGLEGSATRPKVMFYLKKNNPAISHIEYVTNGEGEAQRMRVIVAKATKGSDFYKALTKSGKAIYGGIVINWEASEHTLDNILKEVNTLAEASEDLNEVEEPKASTEQAEEEKAA